MHSRILRFIVLVSVLVIGRLEAHAQPVAREHRVGFLSQSPATGTPAQTLDALRQELGQLGYKHGTNLVLESRFADGRRELLSGLAQELTSRVEVVVALGTSATVAAREATPKVPIVFIGVGDPVGSGFAASLARPGGNLTGISFMGPELAGKNLELLKRAAPEMSRVAVLVPGEVHQPLVRAVWAEIERTAGALRITLERFDVAPTPDRLDEVLSTIRVRRPDALLTLNDPFFLVHRQRILATANGLRLPTMFQTTDYVREGGLLAYAPSVAGRGIQAARYVDKILKGAKPAVLPVEQPTAFVFTINLKTAKAFGLILPPSLLQQATEVIDQ